jgi:hypothetical protein
MDMYGYIEKELRMYLVFSYSLPILIDCQHHCITLRCGVDTMYVFICVYMCMHVYACVYMCMYVYACVCMCIYVCVWICMVCMCMHVYRMNGIERMVLNSMEWNGTEIILTMIMIEHSSSNNSNGIARVVVIAIVLIIVMVIWFYIWLYIPMLINHFISAFGKEFQIIAGECMAYIRLAHLVIYLNNLYVCTCACVCMYVYVYVCTFMCMYVRLCVCMYVWPT